MTSKLRMEDFKAYRLYREVEPTQPVQRIEAQRPRDEYPSENRDSRQYQDDVARRRFVSMRRLIEGLKLTSKIVRVDYQTVVTELYQLGTTLVETELSDCLRMLKVTAEGISHLSQQIHQPTALPDLDFGPILDESHNFFPVFVRGLSGFYLRFLNLELLPGEEGPSLVDAISSDGFYRYVGQHLHLECRPQVKTQYDSALELELQVLVGVGEVDEDNRRAILYQRADQIYALYTDKQISLSI